MPKKYQVSISENDIIDAIGKNCSYQLERSEIREALVKACGIALKEEDLESFLLKASKIAIKDIAKWKLMHDWMEMKMTVENLERKCDSMTEAYHQTMREIQEFKGMLESIKKTSEMMKP